MGIASAATRNEKIFSRPANRSFANAYPAIELNSSEPPVTASARAALLRKFLATFMRVKSVW